MFQGIFSEKEENKSFKSVEKGLRKAFGRVKREFEEHLEAINENTNEIQSNYEILLRLESKIEKIESRINEIDRFIKQFKSQHVYFIDEEEADSFSIMPLNKDEKKVFRAIYELETEKVQITYSKIADILGISASLAREYVAALIEKGVPIMKNYLNQQVYVNLEPRFRNIQTTQNILNL